ncbi:citrate carrier protein, CCS family [Halobacillus karajensis]|uniref:Citrate transporter n=1 Tax=Halobacillus karajensis TaxID=195088 RepID=A0A024P9N6_9BACI|nr:2-hydroxycarboxylate transporter family protein [Halobacillus karajensis]CDQ20205.1 Citrate transporter [Halobacillus karajensis]CDQ25132.1 Citrate transporter [Halobacillus karajensis]CDQ28507.1 Citrate transporter [Halobacillus karajensis]SEI01935.1 citrate carrier protein, CCS family [Halobacillus karajensis]
MSGSAERVDTNQSAAQTITFINSEKKTITIFGLPVIWFLGITVLTLVSMYTGNLPGGMLGSLLVMMVLGELFGWIGDHTPILRTYLGGGAILAIFGAAYMVYAGLIPGETVTMINDFMKDGGFLNFYIAALITGSILGMNKKILVKVGLKYFLPIFGAVIGAMVVAGLFGTIVGFSLKDAVLVITMPIMGGGMGAGAVPMSQIYSELMGNDPSYYISMLVPALALGNVFAIILASMLHILGKKVPSLSGNGQLLKGFEYQEEKPSFNIQKMGIGLMAAILFFTIGTLAAGFIPLHAYALMIIIVAVAKIADIIPESVLDGANQWYKFVAKNWTLALLFGIGIAYTDLGTVLEALTLQYIVTVLGVILGAVIGAGLLGKLVGFYPIESAITAGLCMANMGGTGDVAVLSSSKRMELMPFAQISSRLGGAIILLLAGLLIPLLM